MTMTCEQTLELDKPADEVWAWLCDVRNVMTLDMFHEAIDYDGGTPNVGTVIPIHHNFWGNRHIRLGRITVLKERTIGWGESLPDPNEVDTFPHSESWSVEALDGGRCLVRNSLKGALQGTPLRDLLAPYMWDLSIPHVLKADLHSLAHRLGLEAEEQAARIPAEYRALQKLVSAKSIDGVPVEEFLAVSGSHSGPPARTA